jgi:hypothetical protein
MMDAAVALAPQVGVQAACTALGLVRASYYRQQALGGGSGPAAAGPLPPPNACWR